MKKRLHMIGNAHLDPVWLWRWQEGFQENKATLLSALHRMEEFDDVVFTSSSAQFYEWVEENAPDLFARIREKIKEGRWKICGGWWIQPDCNIPSGEAFARHALLAQNYFYEKFGVIATTGYCVDSFGHNGMLPQLLQKARMKNYVFMRPNPSEKTLPARTFLWQSPDGSRVTAFRLPFTYCTFEALREHVEACMGEFDEGLDHLMSFYGVGNHGGGPTIRCINTIHEMQREGGDTELVFSHPDRFFEEVAASGAVLPVVTGDLQHHAAGCYSAHSQTKALNRRAENALVSAEKFCSLGLLTQKAAYPDTLDGGWRRVLFNQFHDTLAGSAIEKAYDDTRNELCEAIAVAARAENNAVQAMSWAIDLPFEEDMIPLVVFNPHSWEINAAVEYETGLFQNGVLPEGLSILDPDANPVVYQDVETAAKIPNRRRLLLQAKLPPLGYAVYRIYKRPSEAGAQSEFDPALALENEYLRAQFDPLTGEIDSLICKQTGKQLLASPLFAEAVEDLTDSWGHTLKKLDGPARRLSLVRIEKTESGPVRQAIRVISKVGDSALTRTYSLLSGAREIQVSARVDWREKLSALKLRFPIAAVSETATYSCPFGHIEKPTDGWEEPMQEWIDYSDAQGGVSILNDSKYSADVSGHVIGLTVLRSPVYCHHDPQLLDDGFYRYMDQGVSDFCYAILPHAGSWRDAGTVHAAALLNQPPVTVTESCHAGTLPLRLSTLSISSPNVLLSALKKARKGEELVLRVYEAYGQALDTEITLMGKTVRTHMGPFEIKSFALPLGAGQAREIDLLEWDNQEIKE